MLAVIVNAVAVIIGGLIGILCGSRIKERYTKAVMTCIALVTMVIGVQSAIVTGNILIVMVCLVLGTIIGTALHLDDRINGSVDKIKDKLAGTRFGGGHFAEAFVSTSILFCVGTMAVIGSIQAGLSKDYSILFAKSTMDFVSSIVFAAALGPGVFLSAVTVLVFQGAIALLAGLAAPVLSTEVITEMSAVGGALFIGMAINLLGLREEKIKVGDMLPAIFLPILYFPLAELVSGLL